MSPSTTASLYKDPLMLQTAHAPNRMVTFDSPSRTRRSVQDGLLPGESELPATPSRNRLLSSLPSEELALLQPHLEPVTHEQRDILVEQDAPIDYVYFPETMVLSLVNVLDGQGTVEVGTAGFEGMVGLSLFLGDRMSTSRAFVQLPGTAMRMKTRTFVEFSRSPGNLHDVMMRYTTTFLTQVAQTAACNGMHSVQQRCARWLLTAHDRVVGDRFPLTHKLLAHMLGVRRAGVTNVMTRLQSSKVVSYTRGRVQIIDRAQLEKASCPCYRVVRSHNERLVPMVLS